MLPRAEAHGLSQTKKTANRGTLPEIAVFAHCLGPAIQADLPIYSRPWPVGDATKRRTAPPLLRHLQIDRLGALATLVRLGLERHAHALSSGPMLDRSTAVIWTNTSFPPSSGVMKPNPFDWLKNFTVPFCRMRGLLCPR